jgi:hypothetical protein
MGADRKEMEKFFNWFRVQFRRKATILSSRVIGISILFILFTGCRPGSPDYLSLQNPVPPSTIQPTSTTGQPTPSSQPTQKPLVATPTPTQKPEPRLFKHPDSIFELLLPMTWSVDSEDAITRINDPDSGVKINIQVIDSVYELNQESLARMVDARESNIFSQYGSYIETGRHANNDEPDYLVEKNLIEGGDLSKVVSHYHQSRKFVLIIDLWSDLDYYEDNEPELSSILASFSAGESMDDSEENPGTSLLTAFSNGSFSMVVPQYWHYRTESSANSVVDTFTSPDENAVIQMAVYNDGEPISGSVAGAFVRNLLRNYYAKDIVVTEYQYLPDGKEELIWYSEGSNYEGITYFDAQGTELIIYTIMMATDFKELHSELLANALNSFQSVGSD